jgi:toxoflavin biosynthesis protein ToxD
MHVSRAPHPNPNQLPPRVAMGLPATLEDRLGADVLARHSDLLNCSAEDLVTTLESRIETMDRRFAAGTVLAFIGDPRIRPLEPPMIVQPSGRATLGLAAGQAEAVAARWRHVGVLTEWIEKECPQYVAEIEPFALGRFPVTHLEFRAFLEDTDSLWLPTAWTLGTYPAHLANHPVWTVPPEAADAYAAWLSQRTGRRFRLPTEAEWEYAASLDDGREFPWGGDFEPQRANTVECGPLSTTPVGMYPLGRTATGLDDMAGNVEEYTADLYRAYPGGEHIRDDLQMAQGDYRVARGGSFTRYGDLARCRRRHGWFQSPIYAMGFRLAESL